MSIIARRAAIIGSSVGLMLPKAVFAARSAPQILHRPKMDRRMECDRSGRRSLPPLPADGVYEDVAFGLKKKGSAELREAS